MQTISLIIPLYNKAKNIENTLNSVLAQTRMPDEIIVVDDGSKDAGAAIVRNMKIPGLKLIEQKNGGAAAARNTGIKNAKGDFLAFLDADDQWYPGHLEEIGRMISLYPGESVFATANEREFRKGVFPSQYSIEAYKPGETYKVDYFKASLLSSVLHPSTSVFEKKVFEETGMFKPYTSGQDTDLWIRIGLRLQVVFSSKITVRRVFEPLSLSNTTKDLKSKPDFENHKNEERKNPFLKRFLDNNRYALAIVAKLNNDRAGFLKMKNNIDFNNLNSKQKYLLKMPVFLLRQTMKAQQLLMKMGIYWTAFK